MAEAEKTDTAPGTAVAVAQPYRPPVIAGGAVSPLIPQTIDEAWRLSEAFAKAGILPRGITTAPQVMLVICGGAEVGFGPFQSLQAFYLINNRLVIWGDAIPALLWSHGFKLKEWFDNPGTDYPDEMTARCIITRPDGQEIEGEFSVADAKEAGLWKKDGSWQTAKKRMLKMRARAFAARDGASDVLRGVGVREEIEDLPQTEAPKTRSRKTDIRGQLERAGAAEGEPETLRTIAPDAQAEGFSQAQVHSETEGADPDVPAWPSAASFEGPAPRDVRYQLADDELIDDDNTCPVFLNGEEVGRLTAAEASKVPEYDEHPEAEVSDAAEAASAAPESGATQAEAGSDAHQEPPAEEGPPGDATGAEEDESQPGAFMAEVRALDSWLTIKARVRTLYGSDDWKALLPEDQEAVRANIWIHVASLVAAKKDPLDFVTDPTAFQLWMATQSGKEGADAIEGNFRTLKREPAWEKMTPDNRDRLTKSVEAKITNCRG